MAPLDFEVEKRLFQSELRPLCHRHSKEATVAQTSHRQLVSWQLGIHLNSCYLLTIVQMRPEAFVLFIPTFSVRTVTSGGDSH